MTERRVPADTKARADELARLRGEPMYVLESELVAPGGFVPLAIYGLAFIDARGLNVEDALYVAEVAK